MTSFPAWVLPPGAAEPTRLLTAPALLGPDTLEYPALSRADVAGLGARLRAAAAERLSSVSVAKRAGAIGRVASRLLGEDDRLRGEAVERVSTFGGLSLPMAEAVLDGMARDWTADRLDRMIRAELPDPAVLEGFIQRPDGSRVRATGWPLTFHVGAGNVPGVLVTSMIRALLVGSAVIAKPGRADVALPVLFARALADVAPGLASCVAVTYWPGGATEPEGAMIGEADLVVVYGGDDTVARLRARAGPAKPIVAYPHRVSFGAVGRDVLGSDHEADAAARDAATAVSMFDQRGCVSPHLFYVEEGGSVTPAGWARRLAAALDRLSRELPPGPFLPTEAAAVQQVRGAAELRAAAELDVELHRSDDLDWTVVFEPDPAFRASCLGRLVRVKPVTDLRAVPDLVRPVGRVLQTVGLVGAEDRRDALAEALGEMGVCRVTPLASMPWPPPWWHHDGRGPLTPLIRWIDVDG